MSISFEYFSHKLPLPFFHIALVYKLNNRWRCTCKPNNLNELITTIPYPKNNSYLVYSLSITYLNYHSDHSQTVYKVLLTRFYSNSFFRNSTSISNLYGSSKPVINKTAQKPFTISLIILIIERWKGKIGLHLKIQNSLTLFLDRFPPSTQTKQIPFQNYLTKQTIDGALIAPIIATS